MHHRSAALLHRRRRQGQRQLGAVVHMHQAQHLGDVQLHRVLGDAQLVGDLVVGQALAHQPRHRLLAGRQLAEQRIARGHLAFRDRRRRRGRLAVFAPERARLAVAVYLVLDLVDVAVDRVQRFGEVFQALVDVAQAQLAADALVQAVLQAFEAMQQFLRRRPAWPRSLPGGHRGR